MQTVSTLLAMVMASGGILLTWIIVGSAFVGLGLGVRRLLGLRGVDSRRCLMGFWTGFGVVILLLQLWHFLLPADGLALSLVLAGGAAGLLASRKELGHWLMSLRWRSRLPQLGLALVLGLWVANHASGGATQHDSGLYHVQAVRWFASFPVVPGLANLHGRLAFNNASLLYSAMLDSGPWAGRAVHLANGLLLLAFLWQILVSLFAFRRAEPADRPLHLFTLLLLAPVIVSAMNEDVRSYTTDLSLALVLLAVGVQLYASLTRPESDSREEAFHLGWIVFLLAVAVCVKLSAAVFAVSGTALAAALWFRHARRMPEWPRRAVWLVGALPAVLAISWLGRGAVLSGYPAYPAPFWSVPVEWKVPSEQAIAEQQWIAHAARYSQTGLGVGWDWLEPWLQKRTTSKYSFVRVVVPFILALAVLLVHLGLFLIRRSRPPPPARSGWLILIPLAAGLGFWFLTAPSVRFVFPVIWLVAATVVVQTWRAYFSPEGKSATWMFRAALLLGAMPPALPVLRVLFEADGLAPGRLLAAARYSLVMGPGSDRGLHPVTLPPLRQDTTASGLAVSVPVGTSLCWDAPVPCTPHPAKNLRLRHPGDLSSGFTVVGAWAPANWPNPKFRFLDFNRCVREEVSRGSDGRGCIASFSDIPLGGAGEAGPDQ